MLLSLDPEAMAVAQSVSVAPEPKAALLKAVGGSLPEALAASVLATSAAVNEAGLPNGARVRFWLGVLDELGKVVLDLCIACEAIATRRVEKPADIAKLIMETRRNALGVLTERYALGSLLTLGKGQTNAAERASVSEVAARKLVAAVFLGGDLQGVGALYAGGLPLTALPSPRVDFKTRLQEHTQKLGLGRPEYVTVKAEGPEHQRQFEVEARLGQRKATGKGRSKKEAEQEAASQMLVALKAPVREASAPPKSPFEVSRHELRPNEVRGLASAAAKLGFEFREPKLLSIAFTHSSFVNEHRQYRLIPQDILATVGSFCVRAILAASVVRRPSSWWERTVDSHAKVAGYVVSSLMLGPLGRQLGLLPFLKTGNGQAADGPTDTIAAETLQACCGAMLLDTRGALLDRRLSESSVIQRLMEAQEEVSGLEAMLEVDAKTVALEVTQLLGLRGTYGILGTRGPEHEPRYTAEYTISYGEESYRFHSAPMRNKVEAEDDACQHPLRILVSLPHGRAAVERLVDLSAAPTRQFIRMLAHTLLAAMERGQTGWHALGSLGLFGADVLLRGSRAQAVTVLEHLFEVFQVACPEVLERLLQVASNKTLRSGSPIRDELVRLAQRVVAFLDAYALEGSTPLQSTREFNEILMAASLGGRSRAAGAQEISMAELRELLGSLRGWPIEFETALAEQEALRGDSGALLELFSAVLRGAAPKGTALRITASLAEASHEVSLRVSRRDGAFLLAAPNPTILQALALPGLIEETEGAMVISLPRARSQESAQARWVEGMIFHLFDRALFADPILTAFATRLHDLKNLLLAVDNHRANAVEFPNRRYHHLSGAEQALTSARTSAQILMLVGRQMPVARYERFSLSSLLSSFSSRLQQRLPSGVSLQVTLDAQAVDLVGDEFLVDSALENLCKNALEAMKGTGQLRLEWLHDPAENKVLIEVSDSGPGMPDEVIAAVDAGTPAVSQKQEGHGLGLLSVQRIAHIHGGSFSIRSLSAGTQCRLLLPVLPKPMAHAAPVPVPLRTQDVQVARGTP